MLSYSLFHDVLDTEKLGKATANRICMLYCSSVLMSYFMLFKWSSEPGCALHGTAFVCLILIYFFNIVIQSV